jgi:GT2 family glycosyltransferase
VNWPRRKVRPGPAVTIGHACDANPRLASSAPGRPVPTCRAAAGQRPLNGRTVRQTRPSVVICCYTEKRWSLLIDAISSCLMQEAPQFEVVVVVDHNERLYQRLVQEYADDESRAPGRPPVLVKENVFDSGLSGARNSGVNAASGDIICFLVDDATATDSWLRELIRPFAGVTRVVATGGWIAPRLERPLPDWLPRTYFWVFGFSYEGLPPDGAVLRNPIGASMAVRKDSFLAVAGFSSAIGRTASRPAGCEGTEVGIKLSALGGVILHARRSVVSHYVPAERVGFRYFARHCFEERRSTAAVCSMGLAPSALASERRHMLRLLGPKAWKAESPGLSARRLGASVTGAALAAEGYGAGLYQFRRRPAA